MRADLERLLDDVTLKTLVFAIALGWSLFQVASGLAFFVTTILQRVPSSPDSFANSFGIGGGLAWQVGHRVIAIGPLVEGLIEVGAVLAIALLAQRWFSSGSSYVTE